MARRAVLVERASDSGGRGSRLLTVAWAAVLRTPKDLTLMSVPLWTLQRPDPSLKRAGQETEEFMSSQNSS